MHLPQKEMEPEIQNTINMFKYPNSIIRCSLLLWKYPQQMQDFMFNPDWWKDTTMQVYILHVEYNFNMFAFDAKQIYVLQHTL